jgi:hypothetical protein
MVGPPSRNAPQRLGRGGRVTLLQGGERPREAATAPGGRDRLREATAHERRELEWPLRGAENHVFALPRAQGGVCCRACRLGEYHRALDWPEWDGGA